MYNIGGGLALKVFKTPDHPDLQVFDPVERQSLVCAAQERIETHQRKLRVFPHGLPAFVLAPIDLAYDRRGNSGRNCRLHDAVRRWGRPALPIRQAGMARVGLGAGVNEESVRDLLLELHLAVRGIHGAGVVIGDFNDLNVLVKDGHVYMVDTDLFQYGGFLCNTFQYRFLDPLLCEPVGSRPEMSRPHNPGSDWYAYAAMVMQCLLYVDPYGGLHKPSDPSHKVADIAIPIHRLSVFSPEVQYPKAALPVCVLPDDLLQYLHATFERDARGEFPEAILHDLRWTNCMLCGSRHARPVCPFCAGQVGAIVAGAARIELREVRGQVTATLVFRTSGRIVAAAQGGSLLWLVRRRGRAEARERVRRDAGQRAARHGRQPGRPRTAPGDGRPGHHPQARPRARKTPGRASGR